MEITNFIKLYEKSFRENWELPALSDYVTGKTINYSELAINIAKMHLLFNNMGIKPGAKIAICGRDSMNWVMVYLATVTYGAVIVPILAEFNPHDVTHIVNHSEAELLFVSKSVWEPMEPDMLLNLKGVLSIEDFKCLEERPGFEMNRTLRLLTRRFRSLYPHGYRPENVCYIDRDNSEVVEINYTSGTTGFSKGVMLTGENLAGNVCFGIDTQLHFRSSRALAFLPMAHAYGCAFDMLTPMAVGSHVTILGKIPSPRILIQAMNQVRPNLVICVPLILEKIYKNQILPMISKGAVRWTLAVPFLDSYIYAKIRRKLVDAFGGNFEQVIVGGAPLNHEVEEFLHKIKFPFTVGYGMTECAPLITYAPWDEQRPGSCGRIVDRMEARIDSPDPANVPGVLYVRGANVMKGYYKNPEATAGALDKDGWLNTGDICSMDADGFLTIRGRDKSMILGPSGQNIYPEEIEQKLNSMLYVDESLVVDDDNKLVALIYPDFDNAHKANLTDADIEQQMQHNIDQLNTELPAYSRISRMRILHEEFEKTPKRSIKRYLYQH